MREILTDWTSRRKALIERQGQEGGRKLGDNKQTIIELSLHIFNDDEVVAIEQAGSNKSQPVQ